MKKQTAITILLILLGVFLSACQAGLEQEINQAEQNWQAQGVTSYEIEVRKIDSIWHAQTHALVVENGEVVEDSATCIPAPFEGAECDVREFDPADYTVPGLFATARTQAARSDGQWTTIHFDEQYGFPANISFSNPEILDGEVRWEVTHFAVRP